MRAKLQPGVEPFRAADAVPLLENAGLLNSNARWRKRQVVFSQGSSGDCFFYLQQGSVMLSVVSTQGREAVTAILPAGSFFGEGCLGEPGVYTETATTLSECSILRISKDRFMNAIRTTSDLSIFFVKYLLGKCARIEEELVDQLFNLSEKRLARLLVSLASFHNNEPAEIVPRVSQETLARMIGTTRSRVNFFMNKFRRQGLVDYKNGLRVHPALMLTVQGK